MGLSSPFKEQPSHSQSQSLPRKLLPWTIYVLASLALFRLYFHPLPFPSSPSYRLPHRPPTILVTSSVSTSVAPPFHTEAEAEAEAKAEERKESEPQKPSCDYTNGRWVRDPTARPLYNGSTCGTIKDGQNCMAHGRPDIEFLQWRWRPRQCPLPRFDPYKFLNLLANKHIAFVGDSMARNQLESLLCMMSPVSAPNLVFSNGDDNKFRKWHFPKENVSVSVYWSPFLVKGLEKSGEGLAYNRLFLESVDERWASDLGGIDMLVLSLGHWFLHPAMFYEGDTHLGCHALSELNCTEIGFYDVLRKAVRTTLKAVTERSRANGSGKRKYVFLTTFSPAHFEGEWDKFGACPKTKPYDEGEKLLEGMDAEMQKVELEEVQSAKENARDLDGFRLEALDVTKLALLRPDGHPGPYMHPFPFANGIQERVQNDCVHWCLPGPIDTWNEILLEVINGWTRLSR